MSQPSKARELVEAGIAPPPTERRSAPRRALWRLTIRLGRAHAIHQQQINRELLALLEQVRTQIDELRLNVQDLGVSLQELRRGVAASERGVQELQQWNHGLEEQVGGLLKRSDEFEDRLGPIDAFVSGSRAVPDARSLGFERFDKQSAGTVLGYRNGAVGVDPRDDYLAFEDAFRLSEEIVRERQRPYLALLQGRQPVLDVGCGRGEFLELLRDAEVPASGVDLDAGMVARSRTKGLDVQQADAVAYLERVPDESLGVVFAAQVVEHLAYDHLLAFLRLSSQKLTPGGLLIAETVNPHSPGALKNFWFDMTHQHPVFPEVLLTLCRSIGFAPAYVFHPGGSGDVDRDRERMGDYALIAERPPTASD